MAKLPKRIYRALLNKVKKVKFKFILIFFIIFFKISNSISVEIKILAQLNEIIITNQDLETEKKIIEYLTNNKNISDKIAFDNLVEFNIKKIELNIAKIEIGDLETRKYLNIVLKGNNKSLNDFKNNFKDEFYEKYLLEKIKIEVSWNKLIMEKFSNIININMDEVLSRNFKKNDTESIENQILIEKNKKLKSISEAYFNEVKNKVFIKYQ